MSPGQEDYGAGYADGVDAGQDALRRGLWQPMTPLGHGVSRLFSARARMQGFVDGWDEAKRAPEGQVAVGEPTPR